MGESPTRCVSNPSPQAAVKATAIVVISGTSCTPILIAIQATQSRSKTNERRGIVTWHLVLNFAVGFFQFSGRSVRDRFADYFGEAMRCRLWLVEQLKPSGLSLVAKTQESLGDFNRKRNFSIKFFYPVWK